METGPGREKIRKRQRERGTAKVKACSTHRPMKIAQVAPLAESVPPKFYGGTERVVSWLTEQLVALGHDVTLFASGDSITSADLVAPVPHALRLDPKHRDPMLAYSALLAQLAERSREFDLVHLHLDWLHIPLFQQLEIPFLTTLHGRLDLPDLEAAVACFGDAPFVSISDAQREPVPQANWVGTVYHGLPENLLTPCFEPEGYLAFLGRMSPEKGPETALRLAAAAQLPLKIAAKVDKVDEPYFENVVQPLLRDHRGLVEFIGEIADEQKSAFLGNARALLFPISWPEPFGLVMIEAMSCATPIIAFREGSVTEIIDEGVSGFIIEPGNDEAALAAIKRIDELDRAEVRAAFKRRFTARQMAQEYLRIYKAILATKKTAEPA